MAKLPDEFLQTLGQLPEHIVRVHNGNTPANEQLLWDVLDFLRARKTSIDDMISVAAGLAYQGIRKYEKDEERNKAARLDQPKI